MNQHALSDLLKKGRFPRGDGDERELERLQHQLVRIQQGIWHSKGRAVIVFEGFDAAGKGGAIRRIVEGLDPRGYRVHPIGPPMYEEKEQHYLQRFWKRLPRKGAIAIFDRSWYGRVLVERVEKLTPLERCKQGYKEIVRFEKMLLADGIDLVKIFLAIDGDEQLRRFEDRLQDPFKQWKLTSDDVMARAKWAEYVKAADRMFRKTDTESAPWHLVPANDKHFARLESLRIVTGRFGKHSRWMEDTAVKQRALSLKESLKKLGHKKV